MWFETFLLSRKLAIFVEDRLHSAQHSSKLDDSALICAIFVKIIKLYKIIQI